MKVKLFILTTFMLLSMPGILLASTLYVVVSDNLRGRSFSSAEIKRIFLGEMSMIDNQRINLIYPSYTSSEIETLSQFVGKGRNIRDLKSYWSKMIFTGRGNPPLTANNDGELKQMLGQPNSIGVATSGGGMNVVYTINE